MPHRPQVVPVLHTVDTAAPGGSKRKSKYETDGRAYLGLKRDARDIKLGSRPADSGAMERLSELKMMLDRGLISETEYQAKRLQILNRM